jgi:hypothetical protein
MDATTGAGATFLGGMHVPSSGCAIHRMTNMLSGVVTLENDTAEHMRDDSLHANIEPSLSPTPSPHICTPSGVRPQAGRTRRHHHLPGHHHQLLNPSPNSESHLPAVLHPQGRPQAPHPQGPLHSHAPQASSNPRHHHHQRTPLHPPHSVRTAPSPSSAPYPPATWPSAQQAPLV